MTDQQKACVRIAAKQGRTVEDIAENIGCSKVTARLYIKQFGPKKKNKINR